MTQSQSHADEGICQSAPWRLRSHRTLWTVGVLWALGNGSGAMADSTTIPEATSISAPVLATSAPTEREGNVAATVPTAPVVQLTMVQRLWQRFRPDVEPTDIVTEPTIAVVVQQGTPLVLADNLRAYLRRVSVAELSDFRSALPRLRSLSRDAAHAVGYYQATFRFVPSTDGQRLTVQVQAGEPVLVKQQQIVISGEGGDNPAFKAIIDKPDLAIQDRLDHTLYERTKGRIVSMAADQGYFDAEWRTHDVRVIQPDNVAEIELDYDSGPRYKFGAIRFDNVGDDPSALPVEQRLLEQLLPFAEGDSYDASDLARLSRNLLDTRWFNGIEVDTVTPEPMTHTLTDHAGMAQAVTAAASVDSAREQTLAAQPAVVTPVGGEPTVTPLPDHTPVNNLAENLQRAEVKMQQARRERVIPVNITLDARKPNSAEAGVGYGTDTGVRLRTQYRRALLNTQGHNVDANLELSQIRQAMDARYNLPYQHPLNDTLSLFGGYERELREDSEANLDLDTQTLTLGVERSIKPLRDGWQRTLSLRYRVDQLKNNFDSGVGVNKASLPEPFNLEGVSFTQQALLAGYALNKVKTVGGLDPVRAFRQYYQVEVGSEALLTDVNLAIVRAGWRAIDSMGATDQHQVIGRLDVGSILTQGFSQVPYNLRFFAGGDQSIRGYDYKSLSAQEDGYLIGGQNLAVGSLEYSYRVQPKWRGAVFIDAGNAFDKQFNDPIKVGAGVGIRWVSPIGPIRLDVAAGVSEASVPVRLHFFIGPPL
ncbi:MAG: hypothetical protein RL180_276 [Pseudomonadota bacterium]